MAVRTVTTAIHEMMRSWFEGLFGAKPKQTRYLKYILIGLLVAGAGTGSFFLYRWYIMYRERSAYKALTHYLDEYRTARQDKDADWSPIEDLFKLGYEQHSSSYLAPFFLAFEADALIKQGKKVEAVGVLDTMIEKSNDTDPLLSLFKIKRALVKLDSGDIALQESGLKELTDLGNDANNKFNDEALYYLGQYYFAFDKLDDAKKAWQQLVDQQRHEKVMSSPWAQVAQQKLDQIS